MSTTITKPLLDFITQSPTPFHATNNLLSLFKKKGFIQLDETQTWQLEAGLTYVVTRNDSSIIAFRLPKNKATKASMLGAHTDSPCLKIKPNAEVIKQNYLQLGVEVYGGALLHPWMDRDLSIAGRVSGLTKQGELFHNLIDFKKAVAIIPNLAIHLDRNANKEKTINPQLHCPIILGTNNDKPFNFKELLLNYCQADAEQVLDYELSCYDTQPPSVVGLSDEFICSARLDNLLSSFICAKSLADSPVSDSAIQVFISTDHEEVGSTSACGAQGPFLQSTLERICTSGNFNYAQLLSQSSMVSCDNAHGIHPNYADKHDQNHAPLLNGGPVIKINNNQRYATNSVSSAKFQHICQQANVPVQQFVVRSDMGCGSTIGPITASELGIETIDIGVPQWAMHSIRETAGCKDCDYLYQAICHYLAVQ